MNVSTKTSMENNSKIDKFVPKLTYLLNGNENGSEKTKEKFFGNYDIAILSFIGILLTIIILMVVLRFVIQPLYWHLIDLFSIILLAVPTYYIVIPKLFKKNNG